MTVLRFFVFAVVLLLSQARVSFATDLSLSGTRVSAVFGALGATVAGSVPAMAILIITPQMTNATASEKSALLWGATTLRVLSRFVAGAAAEQQDAGVMAMRIFTTASCVGLLGLATLSTLTNFSDYGVENINYWLLFPSALMAGIGGTAIVAMGNIHYWSSHLHSASLRNVAQALATLAPSLFLMGMAVVAQEVGTSATLWTWLLFSSGAAIVSGVLLKPSFYHQNQGLLQHDLLVTELQMRGLQEHFPPEQVVSMLAGILETLRNQKNIPIFVSAIAAQGVAFSGFVQWLPELCISYHNMTRMSATIAAGSFGFVAALVQSAVGPLQFAEMIGAKSGEGGMRLVNVGLSGIILSSLPVSFGSAPLSVVGASSLVALAASVGVASAGVLQWLPKVNTRVGAAGGVIAGVGSVGAISFLIAASSLVDLTKSKSAILSTILMLPSVALAALVSNLAVYAAHNWPASVPVSRELEVLGSAS